MTRLIILEGPDGAGKSTLAEKFKARGALVRHQGQFKENVLQETLLSVSAGIGQARLKGVDLVCDRLHLGELVYGPIYRGGSLLSSEELRMIDRVLLSLGTVVIWCLPPEPVAFENWLNRAKAGQELFVDDVKWGQVYRAYDNLSMNAPYNVTHLPSFVYDYQSQYTFNDLLGVIERRRSPFSHMFPGVGNFKAGVTLMVGEAISAVNHDTPWPFVGNQGCSPWLAKQLDAWDVPENELYWINAKDNRGEDTDHRFIALLEPSKTIALGLEAEIWCKKYGLDYVKVPHPQWHKRFKNRETYALKYRLNA